jgi:hypothetical protein
MSGGCKRIFRTQESSSNKQKNQKNTFHYNILIHFSIGVYNRAKLITWPCSFVANICNFVASYSFLLI